MIATPPKQSLAYIQKTYISDPSEILGKYYSKSFALQIKSVLNNTFLYENHDQNYYKVVHFDEKNKVLGQYKTKTKVQMNVKSVCLGLDYVLFAHQKCQNNTALVKQTWFQFGIWNLKTHQYVDTGIKYIKTSEQIQLFYFSQSKLFCVTEFTKTKGIILNYYQIKQFNEQLFLKAFFSCVCSLQRDQFQGQSRQDLKLTQIDQISSFAIFKQKTTRNYVQIKLLSLLVNKRQQIIRHCRFEHGFNIKPNQSVLKILKVQQISKKFFYIDLETQCNLTQNQQQINFNRFNQRHQRHRPQPDVLYFFKQKSFFIELVKQGIQINQYEMPEPHYNIQFVNKPLGKLRNAVEMSPKLLIPMDVLKYFISLPLYFLYFNQQTHECHIIQKIQQSGQLQISPQSNEYIFTKWNKSTTPYNGQLQLTRVTVKSIFDPKFVYAAFFMEEIVKKGECDCDLLDQITQML